MRNVPPTIDSLNVTPKVFPGQAAALSLSFSDPGLLDTFSLAVDWGDGDRFASVPGRRRQNVRRSPRFPG